VLFIAAAIKNCILFLLSESVPYHLISYTQIMFVLHIFSWSNNILSALCLYNDKTFHVPIFQSLFSLPGCELDHPVLTSLEFATIIFFYGTRSSALRPTPNLWDQVTVFMWPIGRVVQLYPQAPGFPFHRLLLLAGLRGGILTCFHTGMVYSAWNYWVFGPCPSSGILKNTTFLKVDLFPKRCVL
jgi:hypothetical protein